MIAQYKEKNMSRESKLFSSRSKAAIGKRVKELEAFGWELLSINGLDVSMSRETQNKVYSQLVKYEYEYETLIEQQRNLVRPIKPTPYSAFVLLITTLLFVVPAIFYIMYKVEKNKMYTEASKEYDVKYKELEDKIKAVCDQSRTVFFSRND